MPRRAKGPRLFPRTRKGYGLVYEIRDDGDIRKSTGTSDRREAEAALAAYIENKQLRSGKARSADTLMISSVLSYYGEHWAHRPSRHRELGMRLTRSTATGVTKRSPLFEGPHAGTTRVSGAVLMGQFAVNLAFCRRP